MTHIESLTQTDSQAKRMSELQDFLRRWKQAKYIIHIAIYLDVLAPVRQLSLGFQQNQHDPVKAVKRVKDLTWTMAKLTLLIDQSLESNTGRLTFYKRLLADIGEKSIEGKPKYACQDIILHKFKSTKSTVKDFCQEIIGAMTNAMNGRLGDISDSPVFKYLVQILDIHLWPRTEEKLAMFGDSEMAELLQHFNDLLLNASSKVENILPEWDTLKTHMLPVIKNNTKAIYLDIWKIIFMNEDVLEECKNSLMIPKLLLINPFSNAKFERMFSRMSSVKTDWISRLSCTNLDVLLRINKEGPDVANFDAKESIDHWFGDRVRRLTSSTHRCPEKRKRLNDTSIVNITMLALSDLEDEESSALDELF